jgi:hypothetical protein
LDGWWDRGSAELEEIAIVISREVRKMKKIEILGMG